MLKDLVLVVLMLILGVGVGAGVGTALGIAERQEVAKQILICSTGVGAPATIVGAGQVEWLGSGRYRIRMPYLPDQFVDKGMMDLCVIANPKQNAR